MNRWTVLLATIAMTAATLPAGAETVGPVVVVLGDSYVSGEGLADAEGLCGTSGNAWGALVAEALDASELRVAACSGASVEDLTVGGALGLEAQLDAVDGGAPADVVLLMAGGNDLGFTALVADCLGFADLSPGADPAQIQAGSWSQLVTDGVTGGCSITSQELQARVAALAEPDAFALPEGRGGLAELYVAVAERLLSAEGRLVVVGYPQLFSDPARWAERYGERCHGLRASDALTVSTGVAALDARIAAEVERARPLLEDRDQITFVPVLDDFAAAGGDHRLCSGEEPWLHGLTVVEGGVDVAALLVQLGGGGQVDLESIGGRPGGSFHPTAAGHDAIARAVLDAVAPGTTIRSAP